MPETTEKSCCGPTCCAVPEPEGQATAPTPADRTPEALVDAVRERYGRIAQGAVSRCCGSEGADRTAVGLGYDAAELSAIPEEANLGLGCGAPLGFLDLEPGETVLDLGSGGGIDVFLAAKKVGPTGSAIGVDMTSAMVQRARAAAARSGLANVSFREGRLEALPLGDASVDAVTSNCVINLVPDKKAVFREIARVLRPGGRMVISDIVLRGRLPEAVRQDVLAYAGCVSGALPSEAYFAMVGAAGLDEIEVLRDVDQLAAVAEIAPEEIRQIEERTGVSREEILGRVRSITFRARRPVRS